MAKQLTSKNTFLLSSSGVPLAADVVTTDNNVVINPKSKSIDYKDIGNGATGNSKTQNVSDFTTADFGVDVKAKSSGAAGVAPKVAELLKICGLSETITALTDVAYAPTSDFVQGTAKAYLDGSMRNVTGVAGDFSFGGKVGEMVVFNFSLKGFTDIEETTEANPAVVLDVNKNFIIESVTAITVGGAAIDLESFELSKGNDIQETYATNLKEFYISDHKPVIKVTAVKTKGNGAHWTELKNNTKKSVVVVLGTGAGETLTLTAPFCNPMDNDEQDSGGKIVYDRSWLCESSAGNDNFSLVYS